MKILITGGTGLIGRSLCNALRLAGHELTVLSRTPKSVETKCGTAIKAIQSLKEWTPDIAFDAVINLAGEPIASKPWTKQRQQALWDSRVTLTQELVARIEQAKNKPQVLISGSATGYYGDTGDSLIEESNNTGLDFGARLCAAWEDAAQKATHSNARVCLLRTGLVLHPQGGLIGAMRLPFKMGLGARIGNGKQWMSWIHIDDYVAIVLQLLQRQNARGAYNMTAPHPVTNKAFTTALAKALHRPAFFFAPAWLMKCLLGRRAYLLLGGQRVLPAHVEKLGFSFQYPQLEQALQAVVSEST